MLYLVNPRRKHRRKVRRSHNPRRKALKASSVARPKRRTRKAYAKKYARPLLHEVAPNVFKRGERSKALFPEIKIENPRRRHHRRRNPDMISDLKTAAMNGAVGAGSIFALNFASNELNSMLKLSGNTAKGVKLLVAALVPELLKKQVGQYAKVAQDVAVAYVLYEIIQTFLPAGVASKLSVLKPQTQVQYALPQSTMQRLIPSTSKVDVQSNLN